ncbi:MAG: TIGR03435 family protein, partial [Terriglobus sp.]
HVASSAPGQHLGGRGVSLALFASSIQTMTGIAVVTRPVVDRTGLNGLYDFSLTRIDVPGGEETASENAANFVDALKQQLGLRLEKARAPLTFWIVDRVEKPTDD